MGNDSENVEVWGLDDEYFNYNSLDELIADRDVKPGDTVFVGSRCIPTASEFFNADSFLDDVEELAYGEYGEYTEGFTDTTKEAKEYLQKFVVDWIEKHCRINFYSVENVREYVLKDSDF